jgi:hypothetical protein
LDTEAIGRKVIEHQPKSVNYYFFKVNGEWAQKKANLHVVVDEGELNDS